MNQHPEHKPSLKNLLRDERGAFLIMTTVYLPVIVGFFTMAVDMSYVLQTRNMLQVTADSAALAAVAYLPDATSTCPVAKTYATTNMPVVNYVNVLKHNSADCSDVVVGMWSSSGCTGSACFKSNTAAACGIQCNAVQVTTRQATVNNNSLQLVFAPMIGWSTFDVTATAIAVYGNDPNATPWYVNIVQDVSGSFAQEINNAKAADQALETCMFNNSASGSKLGIDVFGETAKTQQSPLVVSGNNSTLTSKITSISVGGSGMPDQNGTDIAGGINRAIADVCPASANCSPTNTAFKPAIVLVTDGLPNMCGGQSCTNQQLQNNVPQTAATTAANTAASLGMDVYTIYFCNDGTGTCNSTANQQAADFLAGLVRGNGQFRSTPTASDMASLMITSVCKPAHTFRLVW